MGLSLFWWKFMKVLWRNLQQKHNSTHFSDLVPGTIYWTTDAPYYYYYLFFTCCCSSGTRTHLNVVYEPPLWSVSSAHCASYVMLMLTFTLRHSFTRCCDRTDALRNKALFYFPAQTLRKKGLYYSVQAWVQTQIRQLIKRFANKGGIICVNCQVWERNNNWKYSKISSFLKKKKERKKNRKKKIR